MRTDRPAATLGLLTIVGTLVAGPSREGVAGTEIDRDDRGARTSAPRAAKIRFEVTPAAGLLSGPEDGRLFVVLGRAESPEPRFTMGQTGLDASPILARDVERFGPDSLGVLDDRAAIFPLEHLAELPAGDYFVQAVLDLSRDLRSVHSPGNLHSSVRKLHLDASQDVAVRLTLTHRNAPETLPADTAQVRFLKVRSKRLSEFHGRPIDLRAGVILPRGYESETDRRYPLRVHIGGYASRFTEVQARMAQGSPFRAMWNAEDTPRMILLQLDGAGPLGDPYQVNSANHGPYGDAVTQELIPYVESHFRALATPRARVLDGGSTGGWVALALQVFYPDTFNGCWSFCPDSVDFRSFQLVNIYDDENAYINRHGFERPSVRTIEGDVRFTMRHECRLENVLGRGDRYTLSGGQWGAWNATYGPRGTDGRPLPLWDPVTGAIDRSALAHWKKFDLRRVLENDWATLGPRLRGKIHIWVGEADDYFLNNAVHRLDAFLSKASPPYDGSITYGPGRGHCWIGLDERSMMRQMAERVSANP